METNNWINKFNVNLNEGLPIEKAIPALVTVQDFFDAWQSHEMGSRVLDAVGAPIFKQNDPVLTTTAAAYNVHYGAYVWLNLNMERNAFGVIPKIPWGPMDGWRVATAFSGVRAIGLAENGAIPVTDKPDLAIVNTLPRTIVSTFDASWIQYRAAKRGQGPGWDEWRKIRGEEHAKELNAMICLDAAQETTIPGYWALNLSSIDKVVMTNNEFTTCTGHNAVAYVANDFDIYNIVRSGGGAGVAWADAVVLNNNSVLRNLTLTLVNQLEEGVRERSGIADSNANIWMMGYDTQRAFSELLQTQQRFSDAVFEYESVNGIKSISGTSGGFRLKSYNNKPIIVSQDLPTPAGGLTPIYFLNLDHLKIWCDVPTIYTEVGVGSGTHQLLGRVGQEGMYLTMCEVICTFFGAQGKLRDIQ